MQAVTALRNKGHGTVIRGSGSSDPCSLTWDISLLDPVISTANLETKRFHRIIAFRFFLPLVCQIQLPSDQLPSTKWTKLTVLNSASRKWHNRVAVHSVPISSRLHVLFIGLILKFQLFLDLKLWIRRYCRGVSQNETVTNLVNSYGDKQNPYNVIP